MKLIETILKGKFDISFDPALGYDQEKKYLTNKFINFCIDELKIEGSFKAKLVAEREKYGIKTTAFYLEKNKILIVYAKGRMLGDVMRSIAHELTHKRQYEEDRVKHPVQDVGGEIEDEANAKAGIIIKKFIKYDEDGSKVFY
jgi:GTPase SAR1 family protein